MIHLFFDLKAIREDRGKTGYVSEDLEYKIELKSVVRQGQIRGKVINGLKVPKTFVTFFKDVDIDSEVLQYKYWCKLV